MYLFACVCVTSSDLRPLQQAPNYYLSVATERWICGTTTFMIDSNQLQTKHQSNRNKMSLQILLQAYSMDFRNEKWLQE